MKPLNVSQSYVKKHLPKRNKTSNKTDGGKVLIIGGGKGLYGAGILSALAATRTGAGYTHLMTDLSQFPWLKFPDFIVHPLKISELKKINLTEFTIAIGPGMGTDKKNLAWLKFLIKSRAENVLVDADALTLLAKMPNQKLPPSWILTPHEGELARLLGVTSSIVKGDRLHALKMAQDKYGCHILLKGAKTIVIDEKQKMYLVSEGTPALAKAGTGDVLLGIIAALRAQKLSAVEATTVGAFLHGKCAKMWQALKSDHLSLRPLDIIEMLPKVLWHLR